MIWRESSCICRLFILTDDGSSVQEQSHPHSCGWLIPSPASSTSLSGFQESEDAHSCLSGVLRCYFSSTQRRLEMFWFLDSFILCPRSRLSLSIFAFKESPANTFEKDDSSGIYIVSSRVSFSIQLLLLPCFPFRNTKCIMSLYFWNISWFCCSCLLIHYWTVGQKVQWFVNSFLILPSSCWLRYTGSLSLSSLLHPSSLLVSLLSKTQGMQFEELHAKLR